MREISRANSERWRAILLMAFAALALPAAGWTAELNIHVVEDSKNDNGFLTAAAGHFPNPIRVTGKADMVDKVLNKLGEGDCIKSLTLVGHGAPGDISTGSGTKSESCKYVNGNRAEWEPVLKKLKGKFCAGAKLTLWGCNVGACSKGASKLHELAKFFGVTVEAQTGAVYGNGTPEAGSQTQTADPNSDKPPAHKAAPGECKKKKKTMDAVTPGFSVPVTPRPVTFPASGPQPVPTAEIYAVTFVTADLLATVFEEADPSRPFLETARISGEGQVYLAENGILNRTLIERVASGVFSDSTANTSGLAAKLNGALVFQRTNGETLQYFTYGDFQYVLAGPDSENTLRTTCDGISLYRLLTWESLPYTILDARLDPETENLLVEDAVAAANLAEQGLIAESHTALDRLIARTQQLSPEAAAEITGEAEALKADYTLLQDELEDDVDEPTPDPDHPHPTPGDPTGRTPDDSGKRQP